MAEQRDASSEEGLLPYWQVNVPPAERSVACPDFLQHLSAKDQAILSTPQTDYRPLDWPAVRALVAANRLDAFQRSPLALRRYLQYGWELRQRYGSAAAFVREKRLGWGEGKEEEGDEGKGKDTTSPDAAASAAAASGALVEPNIKVLCNDWPYGLDDRIVHLVVWTKFPLAEDPTTGDLTDEARRAIEAYVQKTFGAVLSRDQYIWFKNWASLKSVHAVEHFHVMLYDPPSGFVDQVTHGDVPLSRRLAEGKDVF